MITICLILLVLIAAALLLLTLTGIIAFAWPVLLILGIGLLIDVLFIKVLFRKKGDK